jgi:hypothetical protein
MRCSLRDCLICRCPPSSLTYGKNWSQTQQIKPAIPPDTEVPDYGVGLLAGLVEKTPSFQNGWGLIPIHDFSDTFG